jgi:hypothetical protein
VTAWLRWLHGELTKQASNCVGAPYMRSGVQKHVVALQEQ